jgi:signal transduction histidine kinase
MRVADSLEKIRIPWLNRISRRLARGEEVREGFLQTLNRFFDLMLQAADTGDPGWLTPLLDEWVLARTESELANRDTSLPPILDEILLQTYEVIRETLSDADGLNLMGAILPVYTFAFEYTTRKETNRHIEHVSAELEEAQLQMERLDQSKSDFIAIAAHELKTPLTLIEGYTAMLRDKLPGVDPDQQVDVLLNGMDHGARRLRQIVDDMIDVSLIDNRLLALNFQPVWLNRLFKVIQHEFAGIVQKRSLNLAVCPFPGSDEMMFGDDERLYQALRNVVSNAIKYTPDGGKITIDGRLLPGFIEVTVKDSGIGIDPEDYLHIFEKFGRLGNVSLHSSGKTKYKGGGPGLGLPISKGIIEAHGGAIWVESKGYDEETYPGTIFHILLPLRKEPPDDQSARLFGALVE